MNVIENKFLGVIPTVLIILSLITVGLFLHTTSEDQEKRQLQGQTYERFIACSLSFEPGTRTKDDIDFCWKEAMKDTGQSVKRYDKLR